MKGERVEVRTDDRRTTKVPERQPKSMKVRVDGEPDGEMKLEHMAKQDGVH